MSTCNGNLFSLATCFLSYFSSFMTASLLVSTSNVPIFFYNFSSSSSYLFFVKSSSSESHAGFISLHMRMNYPSAGSPFNYFSPKLLWLTAALRASQKSLSALSLALCASSAESLSYPMLANSSIPSYLNRSLRSETASLHFEYILFYIESRS